jgi:PAS domain S-box-containing protein
MSRNGVTGIFGRTAPLSWRALLFGLFYFLCAETGEFVSRTSTYVSFWLPAGLYVAVLMLNPIRLWLPFLASAFIANAAFDALRGTPAPLILLFYSANTAQAALGASLVRRFIGGPPSLRTLKEFTTVLLFGGALSTALGAAIGAGALVHFGLSRSFSQSAEVWWGSCVMAVLVVTPCLIAWANESERPLLRTQPKRIGEALLLFATLTLAAWYILILGGGILSPLKVWLIPFLLWAGVRFGVRGATGANLWLSLVITFLTTRFLKGLSAEQIAAGQYIFILQMVLAVATLVGVVPAIILGERDRTMMKLRESELRFRQLTAAAFEGIGISQDGRIVDVNDQMLTMFGYQRSEIVGLPVTDLVDPESRGVVAEAIRTGRESIYEHRLVRKDGSSFMGEARAKMVQVGSRTLRMTALRDITERKQAEQLTNSQNRILEMIASGRPLAETLDTLSRTAEAQSPEMVCSILLLDPDGIHMRHASAPLMAPEYMRRIDGSEIGPCAGSCGTAAFRREPVFVEDIATDPLWIGYRDAALAAGLRACWSTPIFDAERNVLGTFAIYYRRPGLPTARHLQLIRMATHTAAVGIAKHRADQALRDSEQRFRSYFELAAVGFSITGRDRKLLAVNDEYCRILGYSRAELLEKTWASLTHPADLAANNEKFEETFAGKIDAYTFDKRLLRKDGSVIFGTVSVRCVRRPDGAPDYFVSLLLDITERHEAVVREQQARMQYTLQLIASQEAERQRIAAELHDSVGQNLSIARNRAHLARPSADPATAAHLEVIERVVADAIDETRNIAHNLRPLHIEQVGLTDSLQELLRETSESTATRFERRIENVDDVLRGEAATHVYRIVQEALNNLVKHANAQHALIILERDVRSVRLRVSDDGAGFDPAAASARSGLGLTSISERVRILGGKLELSSQPGHGTELLVEIPVNESHRDDRIDAEHVADRS